MPKPNFLHFAIAAFVFTSCNSNTTSTNSKKSEEPSVIGEFPDVLELKSERENTAFSATLDAPIDLTKNTIYATTLSYCWDKFKKENGAVFNISKAELKQLDKSLYFKNTLASNEVKTSYEQEGNTVIIKSFFDIQLPFNEPFDQIGLKFNGKMVDGFGDTGGNGQYEIVYYNSDDDFALRLFPENQEHEIIICKSDFSKNKSLFEIFSSIYTNIPNETKSADSWKMDVNDEDEIAIPNLSFNLQTRYNGIEGGKFNTKEQNWRVTKAWQQNALIMNRNGVAAKSKARLDVAGCAMPLEKIKILEKHMIVNSNYVVFLKRKKSKWPYFSAYITNNRWMKKI